VFQAPHLHLQYLSHTTQTSSPMASCPARASADPNSNLLSSLPSAPSPARSPERPTAPAPFQRSGERSLGRPATPGYTLEVGAPAADLP
jgi:hypothetical protein